MASCADSPANCSTIEGPRWITWKAGSDRGPVTLDVDADDDVNLNSCTTTSAACGTGTGSTANANIETGTVVAINITNPGLGYKGVPVIQFSSTTGSGAAATAVLDAQGRVSAINITAAGSNYQTPPTLDIVVPNSATRAKGTVTVNSQGVVTGVTVTVPGVGYTSAPTATISPAVSGKGSGAIVEVRVANGVVTGVVVVDGGSGYFGQNTPGNFFPVNAATVAGAGYTFSQPTGASLTLRSGVAVTNDIYLGTGLRQVPP